MVGSWCWANSRQKLAAELLGTSVREIGYKRESGDCVQGEHWMVVERVQHWLEERALVRRFHTSSCDYRRSKVLRKPGS